MEKILACNKCTTVIAIELGMSTDYYGPPIRCGRCNDIMICASFIFTPHLVPTRPVRTLVWSGTLTSFPNLTIEPLIIEDSITWTYPALPSIGHK